MKKRYIATPLVLIVAAAAWNVVFDRNTPNAGAETLPAFLSSSQTDPQHPVEIFPVSLNGGETKNDVLAHLPTTIYPEDKVEFSVDPAWGLGTVVRITRAMPVTIIDGKTTLNVHTWASTVSELLDDVHRPLVDMDRANYDANQPLAPDMTVEITRVAQFTIKETEVIPFETVTKDDPDVDRPQTKVKEEGKNGERTKTYEITREDGEVVSKKLIKNEVTTKPKSKVISKGTRIKIGKTQTGKATWYDLCGGCKKVASNSFKKGTVLRLTNLNNGKKIEVKVDDTGGFDANTTVVDLHPDYFKQLGGSLGQGVMNNIKAEEILNP